MNLTTHFSPRSTPQSSSGRPQTAISNRSTIRQVTPSPERECERERELSERRGEKRAERALATVNESTKTGMDRGIAVSVGMKGGEETTASEVMGTGTGKDEGKGTYWVETAHDFAKCGVLSSTRCRNE
jgi:hypothetical protein